MQIGKSYIKDYGPFKKLDIVCDVDESTNKITFKGICELDDLTTKSLSSNFKKIEFVKRMCNSFYDNVNEVIKTDSELL